MLPIAFNMYRANSKICSSDFKILEALFAFLVYMVQVPLIPVYTLILTVWQPLEGLVVGFGRVAYSVILESNAKHVRGACGCCLDTFGLTGLFPAAAKLGEDMADRARYGKSRGSKWFARLSQMQEDALHCFSKRVTRRSTRVDSAADGDDGSARDEADHSSARDSSARESGYENLSDCDSPSPERPGRERDIEDGDIARAPPGRLSVGRGNAGGQVGRQADTGSGVGLSDRTRVPFSADRSAGHGGAGAARPPAGSSYMRLLEQGAGGAVIAD